jgi:hypothetical protein
LKNLQLSRVTRIGLIVVGGVLLIWLVLLLAGVFDSPRRVGEKMLDPNRCPHCNFPLSKYAKDKGECLFCHGELPGSEKALSAQGHGKVVAVVLISLFGVLLSVNVVFAVRALLRKRKPADEVHHLRCRKCDCKIRYRPNQVGQFARCPKCRQFVRFPEPPQEPRRPWWRVWKKEQAV